MLAASRPRSVIDRASAGVSLVGISTHPLLVALLLQLFLASKWHLLPQPGLGYTTLQSMGGAGLDLPMLVGITLFTGTVIIVLNLLVDILAVIVDPTIRTSARARHGLRSIAAPHTVA